MSVAILPIGSELGFSQSTKGLVQAAFFVGYCCTNVVGGRVADRVGGRRVLAVGVAAWSLMTLVTPLAARTSLPVLLVARMFLGVGEGVAMPAMNALIQTWVPAPFVSRSLSAVYSGMHMGSILGLLLAPFIMDAFGWPAIFTAFGVAGVLWTILFVVTTAEGDGIARPEYTAADTDTAFDAPIAAAPLAALPTMRQLLSHKRVYAIICAHSSSAGGYFVLLLWMPSFLVSRWKLDVTRSALLSVLPMITMFGCSNISGFIADKFISRDYSTTNVRKAMQTIGFIGPSFSLGLLMFAPSSSSAVVLLTTCLALSSFSQAGLYCMHVDIAGDTKCAGTLLGISNTFASISGVIGMAITGWLLDATGESWNAVWALVVSNYLAGWIIFMAWANAERMF
jgi:MFS transporter, ACS family, solute carrier family 17 (sodium-dependent inorganic phosphate cotransporter), other